MQSDMTPSQILTAAEHAAHVAHQWQIENYPEGILEARTERSGEQKPPSATAHVRYMLTKVKVHLQEGNTGKANRWLGFMQGVLWTHGLGSINEFREVNTKK